MTRNIFKLLLLLVATAAHSASMVTATITFTNAANLVTSAGTNASITANSDTRYWTNAISSAATQIPLTTISGTNIAQQVQNFLTQVAAHQFTTLTPTSDGATYVSLRGIASQAVEVTLSQSNWGAVTYVTNTVGVARTLRLPITVETAGNQLLLADYLVDALALSTTPITPLTSVGTASSTVKNILSGGNVLSAEAGTGMTLATTSTSVVFNATGGTITGVTNLGSGSGVAVGTSGASIELRSISAAGFASIASNATTLTITGLQSGQSNTVSNLGTSNATVKPLFYQKSGVDLQFRSLEAGSGITLTPSSTTIAISTSGGALTGNSVWVDKVNGNDSTGARGSLSTPFLTCAAAKTAATAGDTVFVLPGSYTDNRLNKDGVNWHFFNGAVITNASGAYYIFDDSAATGTFNVTGQGVFVHSTVYLTSSTVSITCKAIKENAAATIIDARGTCNLTVNSAEISGGAYGVYLHTGSANLKLNNCYISASSYCIGANTGATPSVTLRDCVLVTPSTYTITMSDPTNMRIYGRLMANKTSQNVTFITGSSNFEVDTDVQ